MIKARRRTLVSAVFLYTASALVSLSVIAWVALHYFLVVTGVVAVLGVALGAYAVRDRVRRTDVGRYAIRAAWQELDAEARAPAEVPAPSYPAAS